MIYNWIILPVYLLDPVEKYCNNLSCDLTKNIECVQELLANSDIHSSYMFDSHTTKQLGKKTDKYRMRERDR